MIRSLLFKNMGLKILSLCFAAVLWYSVVSEQQTNLLVTVPLTFANVPKTMKVRAVSEQRVSLHLEGAVSVMRSLELGSIRGSINLKGAKPGKSRFELFPSLFNLPEGVQVASISPEVVYVTLEKLLTFKREVKPILKGQVDTHFVIKKVFSVPQFVWVLGDRNAKRTIDVISTEGIDINRIKHDIKKKVALELPSEMRLKEGPNRVEVHVVLREKIWDRAINGIKVTMKNPVRGLSYQLNPQTIKVFMRGPARVVDELETDKIEAVIPGSGLTLGEHRLPVKIHVPEGVSVLMIIPEKIKVVVKKAEE